MRASRAVENPWAVTGSRRVAVACACSGCAVVSAVVSADSASAVGNASVIAGSDLRDVRRAETGGMVIVGEATVDSSRRPACRGDLGDSRGISRSYRASPKAGETPHGSVPCRA